MYLHSITGSKCTTSDLVEEQSQPVPNPGGRQGHKWPKKCARRGNMREKQAKQFFQVPSHAVSRILFFNRCSSVPKPKAGMENERINQFMPAPANEAACRHGSGAGVELHPPCLYHLWVADLCSTSLKITPQADGVLLLVWRDAVGGRLLLRA